MWWLSLIVSVLYVDGVVSAQEDQLEEILARFYAMEKRLEVVEKVISPLLSSQDVLPVVKYSVNPDYNSFNNIIN